MLTLNLTNSSNEEEPCSAALETARPRVLSALNTSCSVPANLVELTLEHQNVTEPCPAQLRIFQLVDDLDDESLALSTIQDCLEREDPLRSLSISVGHMQYLNNAIPWPIAQIVCAALAGGLLCIFISCVMWSAFCWRRNPGIMLSYRVHSDQEVVEKLHPRLIALGLTVWWDKVCLKPGQPWEEGFADGLFDSCIFVPIMSKGGLANFATLNKDSPCDNVLLEHVLALDQKERGHMKAIFPVLRGEVDPTTGKYGNFFQDMARPNCSREVVVASVDAKAREHLERKHGDDCLQVIDRSPGGVLDQMCKHQGGLLEGDLDEQLDEIALMIKQTATDVAAGKVRAEARQGGGSSGDAPSPRVGATRDAPRGFLSWLWMIVSLQPSSASSSGDGVELLPGPGRSEGVERFFSSAVDGESSDIEMSNPVLAEKAKAERMQRERIAKRKSGKLRLLMPLPDAGPSNLSQEQEIEAYMKREGMAEKAQVSQDSRTARALQQAQLTQEHRKSVYTVNADATQRARALRTPNQARDQSDRASQQSSARSSAGAGFQTTATGNWAIAIQYVHETFRSRARVSVPDGAWSPNASEGGHAPAPAPASAVMTEANQVEETREETEARVTARMADMRAAQEAARASEEEARRQERLGPRRVNERTIGFVALKTMLLERGMTRGLLDACTSKPALVAAAQAWPAGLNIEWVDDDVDLEAGRQEVHV